MLTTPVRSHHDNVLSSELSDAMIVTSSENAILQDLRRRLVTANTPAVHSPRFARINILKPWIPEADPLLTKPQRRSHRNIVLLTQLAISFVVLLINIILLAKSIGRERGLTATYGQYFEGDCDKVKEYNMWLHLGINIVSTILLGASNYCAQILVAPTRREVDTAHAKGDWFDIGVHSFRNVCRIPWKRRVVWAFLVVSSILLHLMWNSAIFSASPVSLYSIGMVTNDFANDTKPWIFSETYPWFQNLNAMRANISRLERLNGTECMERYVDAIYGMKDLIVVAANITMHDGFAKPPNVNDSSLVDLRVSLFKSEWPLANAWVCSAFWNPPHWLPDKVCNKDFMKTHAREWTYRQLIFRETNRGQEHPADYAHSNYFKIDYCLSDGDESSELSKKCALRFSPIILTLVCVINLVKCICIGYVALMNFDTELVQAKVKHDGEKRDNRSDRHSRSSRLKMSLLNSWNKLKQPADIPYQAISNVTLGDIICSFLIHENPHTIASYQTQQSLLDHIHPLHKRSIIGTTRDLVVPKEKLWFHTVKRRRWLWTYSLVFLFIIILVGLNVLWAMEYRRIGLPQDSASIVRQGLGTFQRYTYIPWATGREDASQSQKFFLATFSANVLQLFANGLLLLITRIMTTMLVAQEWNAFIFRRTALRVSHPRGLQRSSYFLSMPLDFGIPLVVGKALLQWLLSQSIFVVQSSQFSTPDLVRRPERDASIVGYSPLGLILTLVLAVVLFATPFILGLKRIIAPNRSQPSTGDMAVEEGYDTMSERLARYPMPMVGTCSAAISAACHKHPDDIDAHLMPVTWGFVWDDPNEKITNSTCLNGRFCFTTAIDVEWPKPETE
ncbi:hypothetical protein B0J11DRAFT_500177 [Dendryphion nanum]|uniref:DUF6536 domain-containing protein n=1 Tax=Dendryphion nanum TaxID=256645 RepID=A0A9P9EHH7_9PLEO|nr:hypothetical protein B0J11DRAFT_500177 [Dendryphion nanum]